MCFCSSHSSLSWSRNYDTGSQARPGKSPSRQRLARAALSNHSSWLLGTHWILQALCAQLCYSSCTSYGTLCSTKFTWNKESSLAFTELKEKITSAPVLGLPDFSKLFIVETDASAVAIGAVLSQGGHPLAFFSKTMCPRLQASSTYVREMYAITEAIKKWRQYLVGREFHIW